jgi:hypothetical protein
MFGKGLLHRLIDLERLRDEFARKVRHKTTLLQDVRDIVEQELAEMLARNASRLPVFRPSGLTRI